MNTVQDSFCLHVQILEYLQITIYIVIVSTSTKYRVCLFVILLIINN